MFVKNLCNKTLSKTNFPVGRIKVHLILSYLILSYYLLFSPSFIFDNSKSVMLVTLMYFIAIGLFKIKSIVTHLCRAYTFKVPA